MYIYILRWIVAKTRQGEVVNKTCPCPITILWWEEAGQSGLGGGGVFLPFSTARVSSKQHYLVDMFIDLFLCRIPIYTTKPKSSYINGPYYMTLGLQAQ